MSLESKPQSTLEGVSQNEVTPDFFTGGGEMGGRIRTFDWSKTPLGPTETWSPTLKMVVRFLLANRFPMLLWWGSDFVQIYNDSYRPVLGTKHPSPGLGHPVRECWSEIWHVLRPLIETPFNGGPATWMEDILLEINRHGFMEESHFTVAYSPVPDETVPSGIGGVMATVHEITEKVVGERRVIALRDLGARLSQTKSAEEACDITAKTLAAHDKDIPFVLLYLMDADGKQAHLRGSSASALAKDFAPEIVTIGTAKKEGWPFAEALRTGFMQVVNLKNHFKDIPQGPWSDAPDTAVVIPIPSSTPEKSAALMVAGVSARLKFDAFYRDFFELIRTQVASAIASARAYEEERKRAEALAEIDRAKTIFFSNVSHEFRTPLTLLLGPAEDLLKKEHGNLPPEASEQVEVIRRNALRLQRLVNTMLNFSRIEAGRVRASYAETDLTALTTDLASVFRSTMERAGLEFDVKMQTLPSRVFVDPDMWEKIVFNLLSNAFKFTLSGGVKVSLEAKGHKAVLAVSDSGIGISPEQLPNLFKRFHRIEGRVGRTHEGTGIGLALVQELVKLHGGNISVNSEPGRGTTFEVHVPFGKEHLPKDRIDEGPKKEHVTPRDHAFVEEALTWLPEETSPARSENKESSAPKQFSDRPRVILAEDNADMRFYVHRLLQRDYAVEAVADGAAALEAARRNPPDLILSDVMMPRMSGFELVQAVREDEKLRTIPIILLSARAGEEARLENASQLADDYLVKPFSANELLARVSVHVKLARARAANDTELRKSELRYRSLFESIDEGFCVIEMLFDQGGKAVDYRYVEVNPAFEKQTGMQDASGKRMLELVPDIDRHWLENYGRVALKGKPIRFAAEYKSLARWFDVYAFRVGEPGEHKVAILFNDITERKLAENALSESEERFRAFVTTSTDVVYSMNADWSEMRQLKGKDFIADTDAPNRAWLEKYIHPDDQPKVLATIREAIRTKSPFKLEHRVIRVDGTIGWTFSRAIPLLDKKGKIREWFGAAADVTERHRTEEALRDETRILELLNDTGSAIAAQLDLRTLVQIVTDAGTKLCGAQFGAFFYNAIDAQGELYLLYSLSGAPREAFDKFGMPRNTPVFNMTFTGQGVVRSDDITKDPRYGKMAPHYGMPKGHLPVRSYLAVPVISRSGEVIGGLFFGHPDTGVFTKRSERILVGVAAQAAIAIDNARLYEAAQREIAERKRVAEELQKAKEELSHHAEDLEEQVTARTASLREALNQLEEFSYSVSHDLRAPLRAITGYSRVFRQDYGEGLPPDAHMFLDKISRSAERMERLVNEVLTLSRVARADLQLRPIQLQQFVEDIVDQNPLMQPPAADVTVDTAHTIMGDEARLSQAISNLLSNAVKFVAAGEKPVVRIRSEIVGNRVRIWVEDHGIGIPTQHRGKLFGMFQRLPANRTYEGTGIGLAIVRKAVEVMGGSVGVESNEPKGSRFWIELGKDQS